MLNLIRWVLGKLILFLDALFSPKPVQRDPQAQSKLDRATSILVIYQFQACPFCVKVRRAAKRRHLNIPMRDVRQFPAFADELVKGGGEYQVPCLRIPQADGSFRWLYESDDIIAYLDNLIRTEVPS